LSVNTPAQSGINVSTSNGVVSITNTGIKNIIPGSNVSVTVTDGVATISAAGGGGGGSPAFVTDILAGPGIGVSKNAQNAYTITNTGGGGGGGGGNYLLGSGNAGEIAMWGSTAAPTGWALCNGAAVSRTTYAKLFERIGITYGPGDGVNTFNLPNFNNRFAIGSGSDYNNGTTGGYQDSVVVAHSHSLANVTVTGTTSEAGTHQHGLTDPGHTHPYIDRYHPESSGFLNNKVVTNKFLWPGGKWNGNLGSGDGDSDNIGSLTYPGVTEKSATGATISSAGLHSHTINASLSSGSTATVGESGVKKNLPPFLAIAYIIKLEDDIITAITAGTGIAVTPTANTIAVTNTGVTSLSAGSGIILSGSTGGITISASVDTITAAPGSGITIASSAGSKSLSANVRSVVSGPGITVSSNDGVFTVSANTTSAPNIVWSQNSGSTSINLLLPAGQWVVTATFSNHEAEFPAQTLIIDGVVVQTSPNIGDPPGTSYRPMMGMHQVNAGTSGRTITCSVTGVTDFGNINARRFVVRADRLS
jgi:microcystin-dependent protein